MDKATNALSKYIKRRGISISAYLPNGASNQAAYIQAFQGHAAKADEFLAICHFVGVNPTELRTTDQAS